MATRLKALGFAALQIFAIVFATFAGLTVADAATFNLFSPATGVLKGSASTYVTTAAIASDIYGMWSGTCNSTTFLRGDGSCQAPAAGVSGANPTGTTGLTAVNGVATTYLRSDGAPPLSQSIVPTWSGVHTFTPAPIFSSLTGPLKGNGASALTVAVAADIYGLWSGSCSSTTFLRGDGSCQTPAGGGSVANPTALVGLTAINGSASSAIRSDGAPALDQSISPTWSGVHTFSNAITANGIASSDWARLSAANTFTGSTAGARTQILENTSGGTTAVIELRLRNDALQLFKHGMTSSAYASSFFTTGPTGVQGYLGTTGGNIPISIGTNGVERIAVAGDGSVINLKATAVQVNGVALPAETTGTFTATYTAGSCTSGSGSQSASYVKNGSFVVLRIPTTVGLVCTNSSGNGTFFVSGLPVAIQPVGSSSRNGTPVIVGETTGGLTYYFTSISSICEASAGCAGQFFVNGTSGFGLQNGGTGTLASLNATSGHTLTLPAVVITYTVN